MKDNELGPRMWVLLQRDDGTVIDYVKVVGVYNDLELARKVQNKLTQLYSDTYQYYWIEDVPVDLDIWEDK